MGPFDGVFHRRIRSDLRAARELRHAFRSWVSQLDLAWDETGMVTRCGTPAACGMTD